MRSCLFKKEVKSIIPTINVAFDIDLSIANIILEHNIASKVAGLSRNAWLSHFDNIYLINAGHPYLIFPGVIKFCR